MLAAKCHEIRHGGVVAAFYVCAQELAALGEAEAVDGGCGGEDRMGCEIGADFLDLEGEVSEESSGAIRGSVVVDADVVSICSRVGFVHEVPDGA